MHDGSYRFVNAEMLQSWIGLLCIIHFYADLCSFEMFQNIHAT